MPENKSETALVHAFRWFSLLSALLQHSRIVVSPFGGRLVPVNWVIDNVYNVVIDFVESIIGNLTSTRIRALSAAGAAWILGGDIFMTLTLVITGENLAFLIFHGLIAIASFLIFTCTILPVMGGGWFFGVTLVSIALSIAMFALLGLADPDDVMHPETDDVMPRETDMVEIDTVEIGCMRWLLRIYAEPK
jgi:hypothetical protein